MEVLQIKECIGYNKEEAFVGLQFDPTLGGSTDIIVCICVVSS